MRRGGCGWKYKVIHPLSWTRCTPFIPSSGDGVSEDGWWALECVLVEVRNEAVAGVAQHPAACKE